jgi:hypothetical protein
VIHYFGYGSNMDLASLRAKGVEPRASERIEVELHTARGPLRATTKTLEEPR